MSTTLPNFLIVGAAKSGTSSLHYYLNQHPEVFLPSYTNEGVKVKEPMFLVKENVFGRVRRGIWNIEDYKKLFENVKGAKAIGEATVFYLNFYHESIPKIKQYLGDDVRIVILLRNPVDRAYSAYQHTFRNNVQETLSFEEALAIEEDRYGKDKTITPMTLYKSMGNYCKMVQAFQQHFKQVKIITYDEFSLQTKSVMEDLFTFLGVQQNVLINYTDKKNVGGWNWTSKSAKNLYLNRGFIKKAGKLVIKIFPFIKKAIQKKMIDSNKAIVETMKPETRKYLTAYFKSDIECLEKAINKDLTSWKN